MNRSVRSGLSGITSSHRRPRAIACVLIAMLSLAGCSSPVARLQELATEQGFERSSSRVDGYRHTLFDNRRPMIDGVLHVYLEGDGSPWRHRTLIMADPTPRSPLMLRLMALDRQRAIYVGRPCYNGTSDEPGCDNRLWTSDRYSDVVVASMTGVVRRAMRGIGASRVRLFGHSGGGTLALLIAERLPRVSDVVTLAGNLDTDAWTSHHGYTPLYGSLNPAKRMPLPDTVREWHLLGERDAVIPPTLVADYLRTRPAAVAVRLPAYTHGCCWLDAWQATLEAVVAGRAEALPGRPLTPADARPPTSDEAPLAGDADSP